MALKKQFKHENGQLLSGYYRIREVHTQYEKDKNENAVLVCDFFVEIFNAETNEQINDSPQTWTTEGGGVHELTSGILPTGALVEDLTATAYQQLKGMELFSGAIDC